MAVATDSTIFHTLRVRRLHMIDVAVLFPPESVIWDHHKVLASHMGA